MPIIRPTPPAGVTAEFTANLPKFVSSVAPTPAFPIKQQNALGRLPEIPSFQSVSNDPLHDPQPVFILDLSTPNIGPPKPAYWRVFAGTEQYSAIMGTMKQRNQSDLWKMTSAYYGDRTANHDRVWELLEATAALTTLAQVQTGTYELRVLAVPMLNLEAFWLAHVGGPGTDLVVPFPTAPNQPITVLNTAPVYTMAEFLAHVVPLARHTLAHQPYSGG
jgi:hypothetical protein